MSPEHLTVLRTLLDDMTPAPLTYNEAVLVEYVKRLADRSMEYIENSYLNEDCDEGKLQGLLNALVDGGF